MASVFTFDPDPPRVSSPWTTSGASTPQRKRSSTVLSGNHGNENHLDPTNPSFLAECGITKLDPEPQDGPTEYKLHLLLRPRRSFLSLSTGNLVSGSSHSKSSVAVSVTPQESVDAASKPLQASSGQSRQHRLHQLTTQLLWRLQQSSPFHSSSAANLVLPMLPDATPTLKVPQALSPLLPGLEESQGALYEIGVSDDGTFVGLAEDELNESLINLEAMAASLGCKVEVLRKVAVGYCEWADGAPGTEKLPNIHSGKLWVAEALVSPDLRHPSIDSSGDSDEGAPMMSDLAAGLAGLQIEPTEQLHVAIAGPTGAGKSSLLGILSTSALDNGRGKSRLSLLKHRHEIASGVTSSIAQELIGYSSRHDPSSTAQPLKIVNYADGNIASWNDIHASANGGRVVFLSDLPGSLKYSKSTLRGLVSWRPHYVLLCIPGAPPDAPGSDINQLDISLSYYELCVKLELPIVIVVTKLDTAVLSGLKGALARVLTAIKSSGREPLMLKVPTETTDPGPDLRNISPSDLKLVRPARDAVSNEGTNVVPVIMTSAVTGAGIGQLHALLRTLPIPRAGPSKELTSDGEATNGVTSHKMFDINEVFEMPLFKVYSLSNETKRKNDRGIILCGSVRHGTIRVGDRLLVGPFSSDSRSENEPSQLRQKGGSSRACSEDMTSLRLRNLEATKSQPHLARHSHWQEVKVVSVRNLRLPVKVLSEHQIGTVGVDPIEPELCLGRIRKGMILADFGPSTTASSPSMQTTLPAVPPLSVQFFAGFVAKFPASEFARASPSSSLVIGGNAMAYIGCIRAAVRLVTAESASRAHTIPSSMKEPDIFTLEDTPTSTAPGAISEEDHHINATFSFISSIEWVEVGSRVLIVPAILTSSSTSMSRNAGGSIGLQGFVGRVCKIVGS